MMVTPNRVRVVAAMAALALAGGLLTLALLAKPTLAEPPTANEPRPGAVVEKWPYTYTLDASSCLGELIDFEGTLNTVSHSRYSAEDGGGYHVNAHASMQNMRGVGQTTGEEYVITYASHYVENFVPADHYHQIESYVEINHVIEKGSSPDQALIRGSNTCGTRKGY